jgi:cysteinyl-tRNA synthetase
MPLQLYNSLTRCKEEFHTLLPNHVGLYVCGPTVYGDPHLGHAKTYVSFDVIVRYLRFRGYTVTYVQNITDVGHLLGDQDDGEDKVLRKAREINQQPMAIVEHYMCQHFAMMDRLQVVRPDISPRATGHIPEQLELVQKLIERGAAYAREGSVYFDVPKDEQYGHLSGRKGEDMLSGTRVDVRTDKRDPRDFALWKQAAPDHLMRWRDLFGGQGYPGWHTECVAMSMRYLGTEFDIHGGGMDLKFPHHECELAQARALGHRYARYWLHANLLTIHGQKMAKSLGNFVTLQQAFTEFDPLVVRYFIVAGHYGSVLDYSEGALQSARASLQRLQQTVGELARVAANITPPQQHWQAFRERFCAAMDDDFSTPQALAVLFELLHEVNRLRHHGDPTPAVLADALHLLRTLAGDVLGLLPTTAQALPTEGALLDQTLSLLIELRRDFRAQKNFAAADQIRDRLQDLGVVLKDGKDGTTWELS